MTYPYEESGPPGQQPDSPVIDLMQRGERTVSQLSFVPLDELEREAEAGEVPEPEPDPEEVLRAECSRQLAAAAERCRAQVDAARAEGFAEARREGETIMETRLAQERQRLDQVRLEFSRDRQRFFAAAEGQVVRLALAVAKKVLTHEIDSDGLHLRSTVKSALARVQDGSMTTLRVPEGEGGVWREMFAGGTAGAVEVVEDGRMAEGDCRLETKLGTVDLGVEVQMQEIERGFDELMLQHQGA